MQKRLLFLGGSFFQLPPILYAKQQGHYIITCDYLPDNPGHQYADEYHNVSTTDLEGVLRLSRRIGIDGIIAYASDPAASTAAYVSEQLHLPGNPFTSVNILTHKDLYRDFLRQHHFHAPDSASFALFDEAEEYFQKMNQPLIVKPVDSSGSKGVFKVYPGGQLEEAFHKALSFSRAGKVILEEFISKNGYQIAGDGFVVDGRLVFRCFAQEHFIRTINAFTPIGESYPLQLPATLQEKIHKEIDRLVSLLQLRNGALNFDIMLNQQNDVYLMEVGPRAGGNLISELIRYSTGTDLLTYVINGALGVDCGGLTMYEKAGCYASYVLNATKIGKFMSVELDASLQDNLVEKNVFVKKGTPVQPFKNSSGSLGCLILKFDTPAEMLEKMDSMNERVQVRVE
jgi:biotin carboxylase